MATLLVAVRSMNQKATQRFGASPLALLLAAYSGVFVSDMIVNWLFPDFRGRQIARRNAEKREQYEMDRKASVEDTLKGHCRMREYYHRRIERLRSRIAALEEQDVATSSPVAAMENQESTRCFLSMWMLEALDRPEVGYQCLEIML
ncbi:uncharacterized protein [Coffea arabica]|uniref:Uncharacterized protein isoform X7 n=1 Tax=Coffea arabica TaxID=13443 RepID=A0A6P6UWF3_COFAR|nr:uncharacterized protein LOC113714824 isoform X3 [Coffea arabica]